MSSRLAERLSAARQRRFTGRLAELAQFERALDAPELPWSVLLVYGPGGVGKTTLLAEFAARCRQRAIKVLSLDARMLEPTPAALIAALQRALALPGEIAPEQALAAYTGRVVAMIDTYELLGPLETWLRDEFLPQLPEHVLVVLAGREPPALAWRADAGWQQLFHAMPIRNLSLSEGDDYLSRRAIPDEQRQHVLDFTHGHPLALSLVADLFEQRPGVRFEPESAPDVIKTLLELFVQKVPSPAHRAVLEICALVNLTTEPLLVSMLSLENARELFDWLRGLSFIESTRQGLIPHELAREALVADVRWRNPEWYAELHRRARAYYSARLQQTSGLEQQQSLIEYIYLHRANQIVRPFFEWQQSHNLIPDSLRPSDWADLRAMVLRHEGAESAQWAEYWFERQPDSVVVFRQPAPPAEQAIAGFLMTLQLARVHASDMSADPATRAAWSFLSRHAPLGDNEVAVLFRFWMAHDTYQQISSVQSLIGVQMVRAYLTMPRLAYSFFPVADPEFWTPLSLYVDLQRIPEAEFTVGGQTYGVFGHDWRVTGPVKWLSLLAERELAADISRASASVSTPTTALAEPAFLEAARAAIHEYARLDQLYGSPLLYAQIVAERVAQDASVAERATALRSSVRAACELLQHSPRDVRLYRALHHTYLQPVGTQERVAELLDLPFSTYRRHLRAGIDRVAEILWRWETHGGQLEQKVNSF